MGKTNLVAEPGTYEIRVTREFDAPRDLVFRAFTDPALVPRWWGLRSTTTVVDKYEAKPGGSWRLVQHGEDGAEDAFHGVFHEVTPSERIVYTFEYEGIPGHVLLETITFESDGDKTRITDASVFQSVEDRDGMLAAGMEWGANESMDQLEELLKTL
ncbi:MAG: SRPBCC family protein [Chloroflexi bacterium]|nr:SRPBCC family protein [Chloroflexota bacterium]